MEVRDATYRVWYHAETRTLFFEGTLRLSTADYAPISRLLDQVVELAAEHLTIHMLELNFLNSAGINSLYKFAIALRKRATTQVTVRGSTAVAWQQKSLGNLKKFLPDIIIDVQ
ncbi:MAG: hypothetical protein IPK80_29650 [Nannocystis sp.]|nr:hypothetical protein [Nannocystis sp.]